METLMSRLIKTIQHFFRLSEEDYIDAEAMSSVLVKDLIFRLTIEFVLASLFVAIGRPWLAFFWLVAIIPSELAEVLICRMMDRAEKLKPHHLLAQFSVSLAGGSTWSICGAYLWTTGETVTMASGLLMIIGVAMHVAFKYSDWLKGAIVAAIPPIGALISIAFLPGSVEASMAEHALLIFGLAGLMYYMLVVAAGNFSKQRQLRRAWLAASEANEAKSVFLATMSHEIRTPMNGVLGMAELLERTELNSQQSEMVHIIRASGDTLIGVIDDILDLSKIEAGHAALDIHAFCLNELIETLALTSEMSARAKGLSFSAVRNEDASYILFGDALRLRQIIGNLVANAIKFTVTGGVKVEVFTQSDAATGSCRLTIHVRDTGPGLSVEEQARIFDPFVQGDGSLARRHGGTGLGLAIASQFALLMGGELEVISRSGEGATFSFSCDLPLATETDIARESSREVHDETLGLNEARRPTVLVAEDHPFNRRVLELMLSAMNVDLHFAEDGRAAVAACADQHFDAVLMDIQMPGLSGVEALKQIRQNERERSLSPIPVIALTAHAMKHQVAEYRAAGFDDHLPKPVNIDALYLALHKALLRVSNAA